MNILQISTQCPGAFSGGEIGVRQTLISLLANGYVVDYVGPKIPDASIKEKYRNCYELEPVNNLLLRIWDTLHGNTNQRYRSWKKFASGTDFNKYDAVVMDFTKLDYILHQVPAGKMMVRAHNVEADYSARNYDFHPSFSNYIDKTLAGRREKRILDQIKNVMVLTAKDERRFRELYDLSESYLITDPVCIEDPDERTLMEEHSAMSESGDKVFTILLTGSLWFGPNFDGIKWFLKDVFPFIECRSHIVIAGARPNEELKALAEKNGNSEVIDSPISMEPYFRAADLYVAPVFEGAGMKVKVAEAISYGLPVVGTTHAFTGYNTESYKGKGLYICDNCKEAADAINQYAHMSEKERNLIRNHIKEFFRDNYSMQVSAEAFRTMIERIAVKGQGK